MYTKDKSLRITFRCDDRLSDWVRTQSQSIGLTPSAFVRQSLYSAMAQQAQISSIIENSIVKAAGNAVDIISPAKAVTNANNLNHQ